MYVIAECKSHKFVSKLVIRNEFIQVTMVTPKSNYEYFEMSDVTSAVELTDFLNRQCDDVFLVMKYDKETHSYEEL